MHPPGKYLLLLSLIFWLKITFSQNTKIDSLKENLKTVRDNKERIDVLCAIVKASAPNAPDAALPYAAEALEISRKTKYKHGISYSYRAIGTIYVFKAEFNTAILYLDSSLVVAEEEKNNVDIAEAKATIGTSFLQQGKFDKSLDYLSTAMHLLKKKKTMPDLPGVITTLATFIII